MSDSLYLDDVVEQTEITERNVKYWSQKYDLPIEKDGRRNVYPRRTVLLLRMIKLLSETELFTHHFIRLQVQRALGEQPDDIDKHADYHRVRERGRDILASIDSALGNDLVPAMKASGSRQRRDSGRARPARAGDDLDEGVL